jgi:uncharacterized protein YjiS (DUF1127 family)
MKNINDDKLQKAAFSWSGWWKRQKLSQELYSLSDLMLADIGLRRHEIDAVVEKSYPSTSIMELIAGLIDKMAEAHKNRELAWELAGYDDRLLADMGLYRSDISSISNGIYPERHALASPLTAYGSNISKMAEAVNDDHKRAA